MELHDRIGTNSRGIIDKPVTPDGTLSRPRDLTETRDKDLSGFPRAQARRPDPTRSAASILYTYVKTAINYSRNMRTAFLVDGSEAAIVARALRRSSNLILTAVLRRMKNSHRGHRDHRAIKLCGLCDLCG